jgi:hypothetical protein
MPRGIGETCASLNLLKLSLAYKEQRHTGQNETKTGDNCYDLDVPEHCSLMQAQALRECHILVKVGSESNQTPANGKANGATNACVPEGRKFRFGKRILFQAAGPALEIDPSGLSRTGGGSRSRICWVSRSCPTLQTRFGGGRRRRVQV